MAVGLAGRPTPRTPNLIIIIIIEGPNLDADNLLLSMVRGPAVSLLDC